jgi:ABC-type dipeptide/oligopeptide/nickel transport system permease component
LQEASGRAGSYARDVGRFLIRRLLFTVFVLFIVSLITFVIFVKLPASDPARRATGRATTEANIEAAREAFDLNRPVYVQYGRAFFIAITNLCVDIAYAYVDPRVRFS